MERLQKFLSRAGVASRRAAEALILEGKVKVNGTVVTEMGSRVEPDKDLVVVSGQVVTASAQRRYFLLYKPPGVVTTLSDPQGRATIADFIQGVEGRVYPVGRLDFDAEGALLLTDDGELANQLMHPSHQVPRVYLAKVKGEPDQASLDKLLQGVRLEDGMAKAVEVRRFEVAERNTWLKLVVTEGRQHLVKRLCAAIGHPVVRLFRPAHGGVSVQGLQPGQVRPLTDGELKRVRAIVAGEAGPEVELFLPARRHGHGFSTGLGGEPLEAEADVEAPRPPPRRQPGPAPTARTASVELSIPAEPQAASPRPKVASPERREKPPAVGRGRPAQGVEERGGPPRPERPASLGPSRFAPQPVGESDDAAPAPPRTRTPGAFGRGAPRPSEVAEDSSRGRPPPRGARSFQEGPPRTGSGSFGRGKPGAGQGGRPGGRSGKPSGGARFERAPRREGPGGGGRSGPPGGRFGKPAGGARFEGGPRREGPDGPGRGSAPAGRFGKPAGGSRFEGGPRREGAKGSGRSAARDGRGGPPASRFGKPAGGARSGGVPRRDGPGGFSRGRPGSGSAPAGGRSSAAGGFGSPSASGRRFGAGPGRTGASAGGPPTSRFARPGGFSRGKPKGGESRGGPPRGGPRRPAGAGAGAGGKRPSAGRGPRRDAPRGKPRGSW
jgi:23S rRNA pseudouridine2605 synthase